MVECPLARDVDAGLTWIQGVLIAVIILRDPITIPVAPTVVSAKLIVVESITSLTSALVAFALGEALAD